MDFEDLIEPMCLNCHAFNPAAQECRRRAPVIVSQFGTQGIWPKVERADWCYEHKEGLK